MWEIKLTPIPCTICGWVGKGRYANRSTVCRYCRKRLMKALDEAKKHPSVPYVPMNISAHKVELEETKVE